MAAVKRSTANAAPRSDESTSVPGQMLSQRMWKVARKERKIARSVALPIRLIAGISAVPWKGA